VSVGRSDDDDEMTLDEPAPRTPRPPMLPTPLANMHSPMAVTTRPIPRSQAPDYDDDGDFEGDDPPTTAEPVRDDHHLQIAPRSPSIPTRPVPKFRPDPGGFEDDDANPTMIDPHVPTGGSPRVSFDPHARIDDNRRTADLSGAAKRALEPTADLGPAARRAFADANPGMAPSDPSSRDVMPTAPIRKPTLDPVITAPMGSGAIAASSSAAARGPRNPPSPTGPMLRPPPDAPPSLSSNASGSQRAISPSNATGSQRSMSPTIPGSQRASGPLRAFSPSPPPPFVSDRRAAMTGPQPVELPHTIQDPPYDGAPVPLRAFAPPSQAAPTMLQRPAQAFDPHGRIDDSSRTNRWEGRPEAAADPFATPYAPTHESHPPPVAIQAISHKTPGNAPRPAYDQRAVPQVQIRPMSDLSKTPAGGVGRLAPPYDPNRARTRKAQDVMIWGSIVVIIGSIVTLVIWLIAR
jgi:hypothetical protein